MTNNDVFKTTVCVLLSTCAFSCSLEKQDVPEMETYTENFIKMFGAIDPEQDWNMATRDSVTVNTPELANVKVYAKGYDGEYSLLADYDSVQGKLTIGFDAARDVKEVLVGSGHYSEIVPVGSTVDFTDFGTRTTYTGTTNGITVEKTDDTKILSSEEVTSWVTNLQEGVDNSSKVTANFHMSSADGKVTFTMYPIFWNTGNGTKNNYSPDEIGIAYKDEKGNIVHVPIYSMMEGDELAGSSNENGPYTNIGKVYPSTTGGYSYYRSKGIKVTVPEGLYFGFYILNYWDSNKNNSKTKSRWKYGYSIAEWNDTDNNGDHRSYVGTFTYNGKDYLVFEDYITASSPDLNDFVLVFDPAPTILDDDNAQEWILAAEDLGDLDDYDFNDMVISVKHTAGKTFANVTALAAGGILPVQLYRSSTAIGEEFHSWFGDGTIPSSTMINTTEVNQNGSKVRIDVPSDFSMTSYGDIENMGGFTWVVTRKNGTTTTITAPQKGTAPQMICVPGTWKWPKERTRISTAYLDFGKWGENYKNGEWINKQYSVDLLLPKD